MTSNKSCGFRLAIAVLSGAAALHAGSITQSFTVPNANQSTATQWTYTDSSTQKFNPALGTLTTIKFTIFATATASSQLTDNNPGDACPGQGCNSDSYSFNTTTDFHLKDGIASDPATLPLIGLADASGSQSFNNVGFNQVLNGFTSSTMTGTANYDILGISGLCANPQPGCLENGATTGSFPVASDIDPLDFSTFIGVGAKSYTLRALTVGGWFGPPSTGGSVSGTAIATVTVEYDYIPSSPTSAGAPEPASVVLFGSALAGLLAARRRVLRGSKSDAA